MKYHFPLSKFVTVFWKSWTQQKWPETSKHNGTPTLKPHLQLRFNLLNNQAIQKVTGVALNQICSECETFNKMQAQGLLHRVGF